MAPHINLPGIRPRLASAACFLLPAKAPPISAPDVPMFTLAIPQSEPAYDRNCSASRKLFVIIADESPCGTPFCLSIASDSSLYLTRVKYRCKRFVLNNLIAVFHFGNTWFHITSGNIIVALKLSAFNHKFSAFGFAFFYRIKV